MTDDDFQRLPDKSVLATWQPPHVSWSLEDADTDLIIHTVPHECLKCKMPSLAVVGLSIVNDPKFKGIVVDATAGPALKLVADALSEVNRESIHRSADLAHFRRRWSRTQGAIYFANCCRNLECEFIFGEFYLHKELVKADADGSLIEIARLRVPRYLLDEAISDYEDD